MTAMKNIIVSAVLACALALSLSASADDPSVSDRKVKPVCHTYCDTCTRCVERRPCGQVGDCCARSESYECNCHEVCN